MYDDLILPDGTRTNRGALLIEARAEEEALKNARNRQLNRARAINRSHKIDTLTSPIVYDVFHRIVRSSEGKSDPGAFDETMFSCVFMPGARHVPHRKRCP